jgi:hypothetical protein
VDAPDPLAADRALEYEAPSFLGEGEPEFQYKALSTEIDQLKTHLEHLQERKKKVQLINDQVGGWCRRVGRKLADQLDDHSLVNKDASLL